MYVRMGRAERDTMAGQPAIDAEFRRLFHEHFIDIRSYCLRRLPVADANDAVQDTFLVAWRRRDHLPAEPRPWLFGIARNVVRNAARSAARAERLRERVRSEPTAPVAGPEIHVVRRAEDEELARALDGLGFDDGEVLRLWAWERLSAKEIALVVGCSTSAAEKRLTRARARLATAVLGSPSAIGGRNDGR